MIAVGVSYEGAILKGSHLEVSAWISNATAVPRWQDVCEAGGVTSEWML